MSSLSERAGANLKEARVGGGKLWGDRSTQRQAQRSIATDGRSTHRRAQLERAEPREACSKARTEPGGIPRPPHAQAGRPPRLPAPHRAPPASMRLLAAALLLLLLALCASRVDGECREGPLCRGPVPSLEAQAPPSHPGTRGVPGGHLGRSRRPMRRLSSPAALSRRVQV